MQLLSLLNHPGTPWLDGVMAAASFTPAHGVMPASPWSSGAPPRRVLAIRLQAFGDVTITLPYLRALREALPGAEMDFLTRDENADIPRNVDLFRRVHGVKGGRDEKSQIPRAVALVPRLLRREYDVVIDLQNDRVSRIVRTLLRPKAWSAFDRFSPISAGDPRSQLL